MAERDGAAVDVQFLQVDAELPDASQHLRGERLVDLDEIDLSHGETGSFKRFLRRRNRPDAHIVRVNSGGRRRDDASQWLEPELLRFLGRGHEQCSGAVGERRRIPRSDRSAFLK